MIDQFTLAEIRDACELAIEYFNVHGYDKAGAAFAAIQEVREARLPDPLDPNDAGLAVLSAEADLVFCPKCGKEYGPDDSIVIDDQDIHGHEVSAIQFYCQNCDLTLEGAALVLEYGPERKYWPQYRRAAEIETHREE